MVNGFAHASLMTTQGDHHLCARARRLTTRAHKCVRATASYFRAGHLLPDSLIRSLRLEQEIHALDLPSGESSQEAPKSISYRVCTASEPATRFAKRL